MTWFKFLASGAVGPFSGHPWPAPSAGGEPGGWVEVSTPLDPCRHGLHLCRAEDLPLWLHHELYTVEVEQPVVEHDSFVLAHRARLVRRVDRWTRDSAYQFSSACAWRVRDLVVAALRRTGRDADAERLVSCTTLHELRAAAVRTADGEGGALAPYAVDAATYATASGADRGWAGSTATTAFVAARAARVAAGDHRNGLSAELASQSRWLLDHVVAPRQTSDLRNSGGR